MSTLLDDADPDELLRAAEEIGGEPAPEAQTDADAGPAWAALPVRELAAEPSQRRAATERTLAWARELGARWDGIAFDVDAAGDVAVHATRALAAGEAILRLPRRAIIVDNELAESATGQPALDAPADALAAWLAREARAPTSPWRAYLDSLPVRLDALPMFHGDLGPLAGTAAHALAAAKNRDVRAAYAQLPAALGLSLAEFAWGHAQVMSRAFHAPGTFEHRLAMMPLIDLFNHGLGDTTWTYDPRQGLVVRTERAIAAGAEVCFPYGVRSNTHLFVHFGFVLPDNPANEASLRFERPADPINATAARLLWGFASPIQLRVSGVFDDRFQRALSVARLLASTAEDRARIRGLGLTPYGDLPWLDTGHEAAALGVLATAAGRAFAALTDAPGDPGHLRVRDGERAVLAQIADFTRAARAYLRAPTELVPGDASELLRDYLRAI
ncbi:MAG TPA: SET domain-containing protein [Kofleriaceae bacterium]